MDYVIQGLKTGEIAERLNLSVPYVSTMINAPQFSHQLAIRRNRIEETIDSSVAEKSKEAADVLRNNAKEAAEKMVTLMRSESDSIAHRASADIMDRMGPQKKTSVNSEQTIINIDVKAAMIIKETLEMAG